MARNGEAVNIAMHVTLYNTADPNDVIELEAAGLLAWCDWQTKMAVSLPEALALFEGDLLYPPNAYGHTEFPTETVEHT